MITKIAVAGLRGIPGVMGGVETHCEELYKRLSDKYQVVIYGRKGYCESQKLSETLEVKALSSPKTQALETPVHTLMTMFHCLLFNRVDVFHIHGIGGAFFLPFAKLFFPKVVVTYHSQNYDHQKWGKLAKLVFQCGELFTVKYADKVFFVSKSLAGKFKAQYPKRAEAYEYMPNGFSLPEEEVALNTDDKIFFLAVGRLVPEKGFHDLIDAFNGYQGDECLYIAGDADFESTYVAELKSKANSKVVFLGRKTRAELKWLYSNCKLFVLPSYHEGLPISALEAISCNAPVLLSDISQNLDIELPSECYFKLGDIASLTHRFTMKGKKVGIEILESYDWDKIAIQYSALIDEMS